MSASNKKKLRKEDNTDFLTEKQHEDIKEAKKLKAYSVAFIAVMLVIVIAALGILGSTAVKRSGIKEKKTIAAVVEGNEINSVELSYYYNNAINAAYNKWSSTYGKDVRLYTQLMGLDLSKPLDEQKYAESETTWADYFVDQALETAKSDYAIEKIAEKEGYTLSEEDQKAITDNKTQMESMVKLYGYKNLKEFLRTTYGPGATVESYDEFSQRTALATAYLRDKTKSFTYEDTDIEKYDKEHASEFSSYSYASYLVAGTSYIEGGTKNEDGMTVYSDEEKAAALKKAEADANLIANAKNVEDLDKAIAALPVNEKSEDAASAKNVNTLYAQVSVALQEWVSNSSRKEGDIAVLPYENVTTDADGKETKETTGYYVVLFQGRNDNERALANVRHLLVKFQGGTADPSGVKVYTDAEKAAAKEKAEVILEDWKSSDATEESFIALVKEKSEDQGSAENGGLFENITPATGLVTSFKDWALDANRKAGDVDLVESEYGYHIMYYVGDGDQSYREFMIENTMRGTDMDNWYKAAMEPAKAEVKDTSLLNLNHIIAPNR